MQNEQSQPEKTLGQTIKDVSAFIVGFIGLITALNQFIELWRGDSASTTIIVAGAGIAVTLFSLVWIAFSKRKNPPFFDGKVLRYPTADRYPPAQRRLAKLGLLLFALGLIVFSTVLYYQRSALESKIVILVADLAGPDQSNYAATDELIFQLREALAEYKEIVVRPLDEEISEARGGPYARQLGQRYQADVVLWGWYAATPTYARLTLHIESLNESKHWPLENDGAMRYQGVIADLDTLTIQQDMAQDMTAVSLLICGIANYEAGDYAEALACLIASENQYLEVKNPLDQVYTHFYKGNSYSYLGQHEQALKSYDRAIELDPGEHVVFNNRGITHYDLGQFSEALADYTRTLDLKPDYADAYNNRGNAYHELGQLELAISDFHQAIRLEEGIPDYFNNRGISYMDLGLYPQAIADFDQALEIDPEYVIAYHNRGIAYYYLSDFDKARKDYDYFILLDPENPEGYQSRGILLAEMGQYEEAIADHNRAIQYHPSYSDAYNGRGYAYYRLGEFENALRDYSKAIELDPANGKPYHNRALIYFKTERYDLAISSYLEELRNAAHIDWETEVNVYMTIGECYYYLGEITKAIQYYDKALELNPQSTQALYNRALLYEMQADYDRAIANLDRLLELDPDNIDAVNLRAATYYEAGDYLLAISDFTRVIKSQPPSYAHYFNRGRAYFAIREFEKSIADFDQALELNPQEALMFYYRGLANVGAERFREAIEDYTKAIEIDPDHVRAFYERGKAYLEIKDQKAANSDLLKCLEISDDPELRKSVEDLLAQISSN